MHRLAEHHKGSILGSLCARARSGSMYVASPYTFPLLTAGIGTDCTIVVTRYVNQLRSDKNNVRQSRMMRRQQAYDAYHRRVSVGTGDVDEEALLSKPFDPYDDDSLKLTPSSVSYYAKPSPEPAHVVFDAASPSELHEMQTRGPGSPSVNISSS